MHHLVVNDISMTFHAQQQGHFMEKNQQHKSVAKTLTHSVSIQLHIYYKQPNLK